MRPELTDDAAIPGGRLDGDPKRDELERAGEEVWSEPRVMQVLVALAERPDE